MDTPMDLNTDLNYLTANGIYQGWREPNRPTFLPASKQMVFRSRHTEGLANGKDVYFYAGETVQYRLMNGKIVNIKIVSCLKSHDHHEGCTGYEAIFSDTGEKAFADCERIIGWEGKPERPAFAS